MIFFKKKTKKPSPKKSISKKKPSEKPAPALDDRVLTAEGWRRRMLKKSKKS